MARLAEERGLSLVEVLVAALVLSLALTPVLGLYVSSRRTTDDAVNRTEALALARFTMDEITSRAAWASIASESPRPHTVNPSYLVSATVTSRPGDILKDVVVRLEWPAGAPANSLELRSAVYRREGTLP